MCGRSMVLRKNGIIKYTDAFSIKTDMYRLFDGRNDIAPTTLIPIIRHVDAGSAKKPDPQPEFELAEVSWWLIPRNATAREKFATFNARADTVRKLRSFKASFKDRRCLVMVDGFYEWPKKPSRDNRRRLIRFKDQRMFALAGLWDRAVLAATGEEIDTCTVITTDANAMLKTVPHDRMPVILDDDAAAKWLDPLTTLDEAESLLVSRSTDDMEILIAPGPYERDEDCIFVEVGGDTRSWAPPPIDGTGDLFDGLL